MSSRRPLASRLARGDIETILEYTASEFGLKQLSTYESLLGQAIERVMRDPMCTGSISRTDLGQGVRCFHLDRIAGRRGAASHFVYYIYGPPSGTREGVFILRVLHDAMEPRRRVLDALQAER